jgi:hypothetical protein
MNKAVTDPLPQEPMEAKPVKKSPLGLQKGLMYLIFMLLGGAIGLILFVVTQNLVSTVLLEVSADDFLYVCIVLIRADVLPKLSGIVYLNAVVKKAKAFVGSIFNAYLRVFSCCTALAYNDKALLLEAKTFNGF